jgi:hypothetical protein
MLGCVEALMVPVLPITCDAALVVNGAAADNTLLSAVSVTLTCGSVGLPMREEPPLSAARAYRGATARSDVHVPQLPASGPCHSPRALTRRGECITNAAGQQVMLKLRTPEGYNVTMDAAVTAVVTLLECGLPPGAYTPSLAFGPSLS